MRKGVISMKKIWGVARLLADIVGRFGRDQTAAPMLAPRTGYLKPPAFSSVLTGMVLRDNDRDARLHVFSVADFRRAAGIKWDRLGGLVEVLADGIVHQHIDLNTDAFTRIGTEIWCLTLPRSTRRESLDCVAAIARDLSLQLVGDGIIGGRRPKVVAANLPMRSAVNSKGILDHQAIKDAVNRAAPSPALEAAVAAPTTEAPPILTKDRQTTPEAALSMVWTPIWVANRRALGAFQARVVRKDTDTSAPMGGVHAYASAAPIETLTIDRFVATQAARELTGLYFGKQHMGLTVPVHWMSLAPRWRDCIRMPFEECPDMARRKFLKIEVFGLTPAIPASILKNLMDPLEKLGCDILARVPLWAPEMVRSLHGVRAVGVDLAELGDEDSFGDDELFAKLLEFRDAARQVNTACYVWSVQRRLLISRIVEAGFSLVNGPGMMRDLSRPTLSEINIRTTEDERRCLPRLIPKVSFR